MFPSGLELIAILTAFINVLRFSHGRFYQGVKVKAFYSLVLVLLVQIMCFDSVSVSKYNVMCDTSFYVA